jgi:SAM-dependent methyltransferase
MSFLDRLASAARAARHRQGTARVEGVIDALATDRDVLVPRSPLECTAVEVERWNDEWMAYLRREWELQLAPHTAYPLRPELPVQARDLLALHLGHGWPLALYCDAEALAGRRVMEMGCGCGNLGKLLGRYVESYLGTDYSTLALAVARLVSPANCHYVHVADHATLAPHQGGIDTVVGRYFWIHQNAALAAMNLDFLALFLRPGGRLYADFYWPDPAQEQGVVRTPDQPLSRSLPSLTFRYTRADVEALLVGRPYRVLREEVVPKMQRRYVVLERTA